jgi:GGDEF domain-containing protein
MSLVDERQESPEASLRAADQALYAFKRQQRSARAASHPQRTA